MHQLRDEPAQRDGVEPEADAVRGALLSRGRHVRDLPHVPLVHGLRLPQGRPGRRPVASSEEEGAGQHRHGVEGGGGGVGHRDQGLQPPGRRRQALQRAPRALRDARRLQRQASDDVRAREGRRPLHQPVRQRLLRGRDLLHHAPGGGARALLPARPPAAGARVVGLLGPRAELHAQLLQLDVLHVQLRLHRRPRPRDWQSVAGDLREVGLGTFQRRRQPGRGRPLPTAGA
mmetsp:Transcript_33704/g.89503  ORF Transcript_33704/g.89503 Transcript_33704/m.89503 type:complete len:231 (-) Transcript_33704:305-997(-)